MGILNYSCICGVCLYGKGGVGRSWFHAEGNILSMNAFALIRRPPHKFDELSGHAINATQIIP